MATERELTKKFTLEVIIFRTKPHSLPYYKYVAPLFDDQFGDKRIKQEDLVDEGIIVDQSDFKKYPSDVVTRLRNFITAHVKSVVQSDGDDCEDKMKKVELKTICKSGHFSILKSAKHFNTANTAYHAAESKKPEEIIDTNCFIVYMDITKLYPDCTEPIDGLDWSKIYLTLQPKPALAASTTGTPASTDIDRLVAAMDQQYKDAHDLKEETLIAYDSTTGKGVPDEWIA